MAVSEGSEGPASSGSMTLSLAELLRPLSERSESVRPYVPTIGGPRLYLLLLYGAIVIGTSVEFFLSQELWYGSWEVYNTYVFAVSGLFVLFGALMLVTVRGPAKDETYWLPLPKKTVGWLGLVLLAASGLGLVAAGSSIGGWAVLLSVLMLSGFILLLLGSNGITGKDSFWLAVYGAGVVLMVLVPTHEAFDVARAAPGDYPFTGLNLFLLVTGMTASLVSLMFMNTRDGQLGAWLMGAMAIFLVSFHEQVGVLSSGTYEMYDRGLALIGITFSFLPLVIFLWREKELMSLWSKVKAATHMMTSGDYKDALGQADAALQISSDAALSRKFALPWSIKADAYYAMKQYWKARSHYDIALEIDPEDSVSWCHIGNIYAFEGKRALALSSYDRAIKTDPDNAYAWNNKGAVFNSLQWPEEAHACFTRSIAIMPDNFDALVNLGKVCAKMGRSDEAVGHFQAALRIMPDSTVAKDGLQKVFYKGMVMDQIHGWESMGLDTTYLRSLLEREPQDYEQKSKEFLSSIVEQKTQLTIASAGARLNVNDVIKAILKATSEHGATLDRVQKETGLTTDQLVLPMALLMKTDYVHFEKRGSHDVYVAKGKLPEAPPEPPPPEPERKHAEEPKRKDRYKLRREEHDAKQEFEPTASVLMFGRRKKPKSP